MTKDWIRIGRDSLPPERVVVETKIDDEKGCRNVQRLQHHNGLWWFENDEMYVYYTPTHWRDSKEAP